MTRIHGMQDLPDLPSLLAFAHWLKAPEHHDASRRLLGGKSVVLCFEKPSTRTRMSFELGVQRLGAYIATLDGNSSQMSRGESLVDTAKVLSRYGDVLVYRALNQAHYDTMAAASEVPVLNALSELEHPCQIVADLMTMQEAHGDLNGATLAYVGDGNNVCNSLLLGAAILGMNVKVATPVSYQPDLTLLEQTKAWTKKHGRTLLWTTDPDVAMRGADFVATDTWTSMGDEGERNERLKAFKGYTLSSARLDRVAPKAKFLHCLPGHWGEEATEELAHGPKSLVWDEAENRMWAQMSILCYLLVPQRVAKVLNQRKVVNVAA